MSKSHHISPNLEELLEFLPLIIYKKLFKELIGDVCFRVGK